MIDKEKTVKLLFFAALGLFVVATFMIVDGYFIPGGCFLGTATCFLSIAERRKKERDSEKEKQPEGQ